VTASTSAEYFWSRALSTGAFINLRKHPELDEARDSLGLTSIHDSIFSHDLQSLYRQITITPRCGFLRDCWDATPLHWAARCGNLAAVSALLSAGADVNTVCKRGRSVLHWGLGSKLLNICAAVLEAGANINILDQDGKNVLMLCLEPPVIDGDIIDMFLAAGVDVNAQNQKGETVLMQAASIGSKTIVNAILAAGADPEIRDNLGRSAIFFAIRFNTHEALQALIQYGVATSVPDHCGYSILYHAATHANLQTLNVLRDAHLVGLSPDQLSIFECQTAFSQRSICTKNNIDAMRLQEERAAFEEVLHTLDLPQPDECIESEERLRIPGTFPV
jgi:hypothetical protein